MTPDDHAVLERALPVGPVAMISRGFGNCHVTSTLTRDVWRVQYFNTMNTLILNTLEVVGVPEVALASGRRPGRQPRAAGRTGAVDGRVGGRSRHRPEAPAT